MSFAAILAAEPLAMLSSQAICEAVDPRILRLTILPTERCNFRCVYCYEDFSIGRMSSSVVASIKGLLDRRSLNLDLLEISWFGGEPLAAKDIVLEVSRYAKSLSRLGKMEFRSSITTNGYLLDQTAFFDLMDANVTSYQISIDGLESDHDKRRPLANGGGTFSTIIKNLRQIKASDKACNIILRLHVDHDTITSVETLCDQLSEEFGNDKRFKAFLKPVSNLGGSGVSQLNLINNTEQGNKLIQRLNQRLGSLHVQTTNNTNYVCYAAQMNSFVIRANGRIGKCTVMLNSDINDVGYLDMDRLSLDSNKATTWTSTLFSKSASFASCPARHLGKSPRDIPA